MLESNQTTNIPDFSYLDCEAVADKLGITLPEIFADLDKYDVRFVLCWLANRHGIELTTNTAECTYTSVWDGEGSITAKAIVNLNTREVTVLESFDPADCYTEDGDPFECNQLENEYVTINGVNYPCHNINDSDEWEDVDCWTRETGFYYK